MEAEPTAQLHKIPRHNGQFWALPQADRGYADEQGAVLIAIENLAAAEAWSTDKTSMAVDLGRRKRGRRHAPSVASRDRLHERSG